MINKHEPYDEKKLKIIYAWADKEIIRLLRLQS